VSFIRKCFLCMTCQQRPSAKAGSFCAALSIENLPFVGNGTKDPEKVVGRAPARSAEFRIR
jgi:hypothetical protein